MSPSIISDQQISEIAIEEKEISKAGAVGITVIAVVLAFAVGWAIAELIDSGVDRALSDCEGRVQHHVCAFQSGADRLFARRSGTPWRAAEPMQVARLADRQVVFSSIE